MVGNAAKVREDFKGKRDLVALNELDDALAEAGGKLAVAVEEAQAVGHAAEIARREAQPAAGSPFIRIEARERDFVEDGEIFRQ